MVLVPLKKTLTLWMGLAFCWLSFGVCFVERIVLGSGCLVGLCEGDPFTLQGIQL